MAITTYSELQTAMQNWLRRVGDTDYVTRCPELVALAEAQFNRDFDHRRMETTTDLTTTASVQTVALPADYVEARALVVQTTPKVVMSYVTPTQLDTNWAAGATGIPSEYTIIGDNIKVGQIPDSAYTLELTYKQRIPALSDSQTTNWLLTYHPDIYLYGSLLQAAPYLSDDERIKTWAVFYTAGVEGLDKDNKRSKFNSAPLTTRVNVFTG